MCMYVFLDLIIKGSKKVVLPFLSCFVTEANEETEEQRHLIREQVDARK